MVNSPSWSISAEYATKSRSCCASFVSRTSVTASLSAYTLVTVSVEVNPCCARWRDSSASTARSSALAGPPTSSVPPSSTAVSSAAYSSSTCRPSSASDSPCRPPMTRAVQSFSRPSWCPRRSAPKRAVVAASTVDPPGGDRGRGVRTVDLAADTTTGWSAGHGSPTCRSAGHHLRWPAGDPLIAGGKNGLDMTLAIAVDDRPPDTVVSVGGELDLTTAPELLQALTRLVDDGYHHLIVDLTGLDFCDSSGLSVLVRVKNRLDEVGGNVTLAGATPVVERVLEVSGLAELFGSYRSVAEAQAARRGASVIEPVVDDR